MSPSRRSFQQNSTVIWPAVPKAGAVRRHIAQVPFQSLPPMWLVVHDLNARDFLYDLSVSAHLFRVSLCSPDICDKIKYHVSLNLNKNTHDLQVHTHATKEQMNKREGYSTQRKLYAQARRRISSGCSEIFLISLTLDFFNQKAED